MENNQKNSLFHSISDRTIGFISVLISTFIMDSFGVLVRQASADSGMIAFSRSALGCLFLAGCLVVSQQWQAFRIRISLPLVLSGIFLAFCILFYSKALKTTALANAVFLLYLAPLIATIMGSCLLKEKISAIKTLLILCAFAGLVCLLDFDFAFTKIATHGKSLALAAAFCYALFIVANRKIDAAIGGFSRAFYQLLISALVMLPFIGTVDLPSIYDDRYSLLAIGFFQGFVALTLMIVSLRYLRAYEFATISYLEPIIGAAAGYLLFNETLSWLQVSGAALILISGFVQMRFSLEEPERKE